jgi:hypothetical protein
MKTLSRSIVTLMIAAALAAPASARPLGAIHGFNGGLAHPNGGVHLLNPNTSLSPPGSTPFQQQMQQNTATQLQQTQRDLLQQNPSGLSRSELAVGHELNGYTSSPH